jgi:two-component system sensor histidine kinase BarA
MHTRLFDQLPDDAEDLRKLEIGGDRKQLLEHVHRLHGATRYCGTPRLEALAGKLETLLKSDAGDDNIRLALSALIEEMQLLSNQDSLSIITKASA